MSDIRYGFKREISLSMDQTEQKVRDLLKEEGFGVLTEIDVKATLKTKLDVDTTPYKIFGACNPPIAHKAISIEPDLGLFLPCNLIIYESGPGKTTVAAVNPMEMMSSVDNPGLSEIAPKVTESMRRVINSL
jgi:uncharacterized protein (DUF302 family)